MIMPRRNIKKAKIKTLQYDLNEISSVGGRCSVCGRVERYFFKYDALCCFTCDEWIESSCSDPDCEFCASRPDYPSEALGLLMTAHKEKMTMERNYKTKRLIKDPNQEKYLNNRKKLPKDD